LNAALKIYIYGYLNRIQSSRRLEREAQRNIEIANNSQPGSLRDVNSPTSHKIRRTEQSG
jgi:transposase